MKRQLSTLTLSILICFPASIFAECSSVVFWNKLGSVDEIHNSEIGPGIQLRSYRFSDWQEAEIVPAQFGNGLYISKDTCEGWCGDGGNFFAINVHEIGLTPQRGTIEFWFQFEYDAGVHNEALFFTTRNALTDHFPDSNVTTNVGLGAVWNGWDYGSYGKRFYLGIGDRSRSAGIYTPNYSAAPGGALAFSVGTRFHFGFVWDIDGIDGTADTLRLYVNGNVEASTSDTWSTAGGLDPYLYLGTAPNYGPRWDHYYNAVKGVTDNLIIWNCARTDFSHRFEERPPLNDPPVADAGPDEVVECTDALRTPVELDGSGSYDPDSDPLTCEWYFEDGGRIVGCQPSALLPLGVYPITLVVADSWGATDDDEVVKRVADTTAPEIHGAAAHPDVLWPPNHKMRSVSVEVASSDVCDHEPPVCRIVSVASNEPLNGLGDGDAAPDWEITGDLTIDLRAERSGTGSGRIYTLEITCQDASRNVATSSIAVSVPHDRK